MGQLELTSGPAATIVGVSCKLSWLSVVPTKNIGFWPRSHELWHALKLQVVIVAVEAFFGFVYKHCSCPTQNDYIVRRRQLDVVILQGLLVPHDDVELLPVNLR